MIYYFETTNHSDSTVRRRLFMPLNINGTSLGEHTDFANNCRTISVKSCHHEVID